MQTLRTLKTIATVAMVGGVGLIGSIGTANALSVTFDMFTSTNGISLSPTVTVTENGNNFDVSIDLDALDIGSLRGVYMDFSPSPTAAQIATLGITPTAPNSFGVGGGVVYGNTVNTLDASGNVCGGGTNISGLSGLPLFELAACYNKDVSAGVDPIMFTITDIGNVLALMDFNAFGLRYQESNNCSPSPCSGASDKLLGFKNMSVVPIPAAGLLLLGALGSLGVMARRRRKAA